MYLVNLLCSALIIIFSYLFIARRLYDKTINFTSRRFYITVIFLIVLLPLITIFFDNFLRTVLSYISIVMAYQYLFGGNFYKSILVGSCLFVYYFFAEIIFSLILMVGFKVDSTEMISNWKGLFWTDGIISFIAILISYIKPVNHYFYKLINVKDKPRYLEVVLIGIFCIGIFASANALFLGFNINYVINLFLIAIFCTMIYYLIKEKQYSTQLSEQYELLFRYIGKYETELTEKSMCIHEFKNQIIAIKGFTTKKDKDLSCYIDSIISDLKKTETKVLKDMQNVPTGGLKGLIYYKLGYLDEEGIKVLLHISSNTKKSDFCKVKPNIYTDILKIIGIYLDNAVEAARLATKKEIVLEIYYEQGVLNFILSNTFHGTIDINLFGMKKFSTKEKGRGYGLLLANNVCSKYAFINQKREIISDYYTQTLSIDLKNIPML